MWVAFVVANVADYAAQGLPSAHFGAVLGAVLLLVTGVAYTLALRPKVIEDGDGLTVVNPFRVPRLPWPVIDSVDTGEWVRVRYAAEASGPGSQGRAVYCWALYVSTRARRKVAVGTAAGAPGLPRRLRGRAARRLRAAVLPAPRGGPAAGVAPGQRGDRGPAGQPGRQGAQAGGGEAGRNEHGDDRLVLARRGGGRRPRRHLAHRRPGLIPSPGPEPTAKINPVISNGPCVPPVGRARLSRGLTPAACARGQPRRSPGRRPASRAAGTPPPGPRPPARPRA